MLSLPSNAVLRRALDRALRRRAFPDAPARDFSVSPTFAASDFIGLRCPAAR